MQLNAVIEIYLRRTLVATATNSGTKIAITRLTEQMESGFLHRTLVAMAAKI